MLFISLEDPLTTMWSPPPPSLDAAREVFEAHEVVGSNEFELRIKSMVAHAGDAVAHILSPTPIFPSIPPLLLTTWAISGIKTPYEIELIREANAISSRAYEVIMRVLGKDMKEVGGKVGGKKAEGAVMPGQCRIEKEAEAEAIFVASCSREGPVHQAYMPIVAPAQHAATLYYCCNDRAFAWGPVNSEQGNLATQDYGHGHDGATNGRKKKRTLAPQVLLLDAGCEWRNYTSDKSDILDSQVSSAFFPHRVGHSLGLDVHDVPSASKPEPVSSAALSRGHSSFYMYLRSRLPFAIRMVLAVELRIDCSPHHLAPVRDSEYINHEVLAKDESVGGVRIEDVLDITEDGCENLTTVGKSVQWIEKLASREAQN
ncbi:Creatinase/aminopeptidase [Ceratobasidium sp. AG-I]|nr:Creatinase/aminopeptidase [Ceratobasidium sp. AG-I]